MTDAEARELLKSAVTYKLLERAAGGRMAARSVAAHKALPRLKEKPPSARGLLEQKIREAKPVLGVGPKSTGAELRGAARRFQETYPRTGGFETNVGLTPQPRIDAPALRDTAGAMKVVKVRTRKRVF